MDKENNKWKIKKKGKNQYEKHSKKFQKKKFEKIKNIIRPKKVLKK